MSTSARASSTAKKGPKRPRDVNLLAASIVAEATAEREPGPPAAESEPAAAPRKKNPAAVRLGKLGGLARAKGGGVEKISPERRREIAKKAAAARWG